MNSSIRKIIVVCIVLILTYIGFSIMTPSVYQGEIADPVQVNLEDSEPIYIEFEGKNIQVDLLAEYSIEAIVKSKKKYSDYASEISNYDLALAWGTLNQNDIDEHIRYSQSGRWYYYKWDGDSLVSGSYIAQHSANVHIIHKNIIVLNDIKDIDVDDHIRLEGYLVNVNFAHGDWTSSLTRNDTGNHACEIMYVTSVEILD